MPDKRQKRKAYYKKHADCKKALARDYYVANKGTIIDSVEEKPGSSDY